MWLKSTSFSLTVPNRTSTGGTDFSLQSHEFYSCIQFEIRKKIGLFILLNCEAESLTVFTTMFPNIINRKELVTMVLRSNKPVCDNLTVKDNCSIIEIFDKFSFISILKGCLCHLNEAQKE